AMDGQVPKRRVTGQQKFLLFAGVIMPAISITTEATTHMCAESLFDPIPTTWHLLMVIFVPLAQLHVWFTIRRGATERLTLAGWANALTIGISLFYSFLYLPLLPIAALMLLFGIGLLPLAPLLSLVASLVMRHKLSELGSRAPQKSLAVTKRGVFIGLAAVVVLLGLIELPATLTRYGLQMATSGSPVERAEGVRFLRKYGNESYLLLNCYYRTGWPTDFIGYLLSEKDPVSPVEAREVYYRVTGETFGTSAPPRRVGGGNFLPEDELEFDEEQGGMQVGARLRGLSLRSSTIDASADGDGGVGYMQWTMSFRNDSAAQREARAEIQLPPGAVVSRLTLWVNGEEREAAFAGRAKVRQAYQSIVNQRRDPVLVTTTGRDRILVQCFPVQPNGGVMKIRIGVSVPLLLDYRTRALMLLPHFNQRNFRIPDDVRHSVWIESKNALIPKYPALVGGQPSRGVYALRGELRDQQLATSPVNVARRDSTEQVWGRNPFEGSGHIVQQVVEERRHKHLNRIVLVIDTSESMRQFTQEIQLSLQALSIDFDVKTVFADSNSRYEAYAKGLTVASGREESVAALGMADFAGGADNVPALVKAWELAAEKPGHNVIVWIHGPQLLQLEPVDRLKQRWERPHGPLLYSVQTKPGPDEIEKSLDAVQEVKRVPRVGGLQKDLANLFAQITGEMPSFEFVRTSGKVEEYPQFFATETSDHLARLWARDEVVRLLSTRDESLTEAATMLAVRYQLVTPVSGAVVLETAEQYKAAGLQPVDAGTVPTIPEPEMLILLVIMGIFMVWVVYQKNRRSGNGGCTV
ncbi:MAG TPA: VIT domain-containing protein, partial [Pyrinomonadaceae bacterium]|nr:VIT domain-containing protein [Pyrinomonadaceae bacterium]